MSHGKSLLKCLKVTKSFGGLVALKDIDLTVNEGEIVGLIGPNGSGKTTLISCISGFYKPTAGEIIFKDKKITRLKPYNICKMGVVRTFQIPRPFVNLTALENVMVSTAGDKQLALHYLETVGLLEMRDVLARNLTSHQTKMVEIARALATKPKIMLLDEVMAGLNPIEIDYSIKLLKEIRESGITLVWVEHVMRAIMRAAERIIVLHEGKKIAQGEPRELANNQKVIDAYLGERYIL